MSCSTWVGWDIVHAAEDFSVLAGVLAGFVIASAAILFASAGRYVPNTLALFASGVPALALSSYLFSAIAGTAEEVTEIKTPNVVMQFISDAETHVQSDRCAQIWSQSLIAIAMLLIGGAVLLCGLGWTLVSYIEDFRATLLLKRAEYRTVEREAQELGLDPNADLKKPGAYSSPEKFKNAIRSRSILLISLNGWLFCAAIPTAAALLICANRAYIKAFTDDPVLRRRLIFVVSLIGLYVIFRSLYIIVLRTLDARRSITSQQARNAESEKVTTQTSGFQRMLDTGLIIFAVTVAAWLAGYADPCLTNFGSNCHASDCTKIAIGIFVISAVIIGIHALYRLINDVGEETYRKWPTRPGVDATSSFTEESDRFKEGRLTATTYSIVLLSIAGTIFAALLMQKPLRFDIRTYSTMFLGGFYPSVILLGLSRSVAASRNAYRIPFWMNRDTVNKNICRARRCWWTVCNWLP
ncbi:hypothetical protein [Mycobacterium asiaticum]|nr:hypothetical protein [Mycobacterium asiaticum]